jgi:TonB-linked SusC/RagA family outer membrane protein
MNLKTLCSFDKLRKTTGLRRQLTKMPPQTVRIMKITAIILLSACLTASAKGDAQNITLSEKNVPLQKVFKEIHKQTGYQFFYEDELLNQAGKVDITVKNASLEQVLILCFKNLPFTYTIVNKTIVVKANEVQPKKLLPPLPPPIDIKGKVTNEKGEPIIATVTVKGTNKSVSTNDNGEFTIAGVDENATLVITGVNIETKEMKVGGKNNLAISVKAKVTQQHEVMVTAYGIEKSTKEIGYSVAKVTGEELNKTNPPNLLTGLTARVSGLSVSTQSPDMNPQMKVLLRGVRSISEGANNQPLLILNGAPLSFGASQNASNLALDFINNINPNDVEDVTVLKGANGTALYGPEGVNGVIIITTKKGNRSSSKPNISFSTSAAFQVMDFRNQNFQKSFGPGSTSDQFGNGIYDPTAMGGWGPKFNGELVQIGRPDENGQVQKVPYRYTNERRKFWDVSHTIKNDVSISAGDNRSDIYLGLGYYTQTGVLPGDKKNQASIILNTGRQFGKFSARLNMVYVRANLDQGPPITSLELIPAHIPVTRYKDYKNDHWSDANHYWSDYNSNIYQTIGLVRKKSTYNILSGSLELSYKPLRWLTVKNRLGLNYQGDFAKTTTGPIYYSDWARLNGPIRNFDGYPSLKEESETINSINDDLLFQTVHSLGSFVIKSTAGSTIRENYIKKIDAEADRLAVPVYNLDFSQFPPRITERSELTRFFSFFGEASAGYKDRIFFAVTGRNDWDSRLAKVARKKNFYYGANTAIVLTQVFQGLSKLKWLDEIRLRASVTRSANMNIEPYQFERTLTRASGFPYGTVIGYDFGGAGVPNPALKPEKIASQEYGVLFSFLKQRVTLDATYYYQRNKGMILQVYHSGYSGAPNMDNIGKFANYGVEFDLKVDPVIKMPSGFSLAVAGRFSINDNKLLELSENYNGELPGVNNGLFSLVATTGSHAYAYKVFDWKRDDQGRVIVDRMTGMPNADMSKPIIKGRSLPKYIAGISLNASWKKLSFSVLGEYNGGHDHFFLGGGDLLLNGMHPLTTQNDRERFVFPNSVYDDGTGKFVENKDVTVSSTGRDLYFRYMLASNHLLGSAAFWKIKEMTIGYEISFKKVSTRKLRLSLSARDLFSFFPRSNIIGDPQLIRGPGARNNSTYSSGSSSNEDPSRGNGSGSSSDISRVPGTFILGFRAVLSL